MLAQDIVFTSIPVLLQLLEVSEMSELSMMPDGNMSNCTCMPMSMTMQVSVTVVNGLQT